MFSVPVMKTLLSPVSAPHSSHPQDNGEGNARGILDLLHPFAALFFLSLKYESFLLYSLMFTLTTVPNGTEQSAQKSALFPS